MTTVELNVPVDSGEVSGLARRWFEAAAEQLFPDVIAGLRDGEVALPRSQPGVGDSPWGEAGSMWAAFVRVGNAWGRVTSRRAWSARGWETFLKGLAKFPAGAEMHMVELDANGYSRHGDRADITVRIAGEDSRWLRMGCDFETFPDGPGNRIAQITDEDALRFLWGMVQDIPVTFGGVGDDWRPNGKTMLETALARNAMVGVAESRSVLRGYPWVTVCAPEIAARLGGPDALLASGAFHQVRELPTGAVWLQATERLTDYEGAALRRVFHTVAPVLPPGKPKPYLGQELGRIVYEEPHGFGAA